MILYNAFMGEAAFIAFIGEGAMAGGGGLEARWWGA